GDLHVLRRPSRGGRPLANPCRRRVGSAASVSHRQLHLPRDRATAARTRAGSGWRRRGGMAYSVPATTRRVSRVQQILTSLNGEICFVRFANEEAAVHLTRGFTSVPRRVENRHIG